MISTIASFMVIASLGSVPPSPGGGPAPVQVGYSPDSSAPPMTWTTPVPGAVTVSSNAIFTYTMTVGDFDTYTNGTSFIQVPNNNVWVNYTINSGTLFEPAPPQPPVPNHQCGHPSAGTNVATWTILSRVVTVRSMYTDVLYAIDNQANNVKLHDADGTLQYVTVTVNPEPYKPC